MTPADRSRTVLLLGAGISIDAAMPSVETITAQVLTGEGAWLHTNKVFFIDPTHPNYDLYRPPVEPVLALIGDLREHASAYLGREPNYEEIASLARQIDDALRHEYESAGFVPLANELQQRSYVRGSPDRLRELTGLTVNYIADTVCQMLAKQPTGLDHLSAILEACRRLPRVDLVTLNHDLVLETALDAAGIDYADGFQRNDDEVRLWLDDWCGTNVRLLKLHGSLDWWAYQIAQEPWRGWVTARYRGEDVAYPKRPGLDLPHDLRPVLLTGTFDKILAYETWIFPDQHFRFHESLRAAKRVVVIGYGFGDKAINTRLIAWLARRRENKLIVCHPNPDGPQRARGAIREKWTRWHADGQLAVIPAYVADLDYEVIAALLVDEP